MEHDNQSPVIEPFKPGFELPSRLGKQAVAALDAAAQSQSFDEDLLHSAPANDMRLQIEAMLSVLVRMDPGKMLRRQGAISRLTGADVEARLEFELMSKKVMSVADRLRQAAGNASRARSLLHASKRQIISDNARLDTVITEAKKLLEHEQRGDDEHQRARFERRLSNLIAIRVSNDLTVKQIGLAVQLLSGLIDRFTDIDTLLLPLWQRNVIALVHAGAGKPCHAAAAAFLETNQNLQIHLQQELA